MRNKVKKCSKRRCNNKALAYTSICREHCRLYHISYRRSKSGKIACSNASKRYKSSLKGKMARKREYLSAKLRNSKFIYRKMNKKGFLVNLYKGMKNRVNGVGVPSHKLKYWYGKSIMPKETFYEWALHHPDFLKLFKRWKTSNHDRRLTPSVNRIDSLKGYTLDNVEWMTHAQNSGLAGSIKHSNHKAVKEIYKIAGVNV